MFYLRPTKLKMIISFIPIMVLFGYILINIFCNAFDLKYDSFLSILGAWVYIIYTYPFKLLVYFLNFEINIGLDIIVASMLYVCIIYFIYSFSQEYNLNKKSKT